MDLQWRPFAGPDDTGLMIDLLRQFTPWNEGGAGWLHPGDVVWRMYQNLSATPEKEMRIISDASGQLVAIVEVLAPDTYYVHMPAGIADLEAVLRFAAGEAERELRAVAPDEGEESPTIFETEVLSVQPRAAEILEQLGFTIAGDPQYRLNGQPLGDDLPAPDLRDGAIVRAVRDDPADLQARVDLHRDVWTGSKLDLAGYERLRTKPLYRPDLDLVVETPEGDLAAYCIVWWDPVTKMGEFEPVGTAERFRGRGFGKAILREGLRRIRDLGGTYATVINTMDEKGTASRGLYPSAGFTPVATFARYTRAVHADQESPR